MWRQFFAFFILLVEALSIDVNSSKTIISLTKDVSLVINASQTVVFNVSQTNSTDTDEAHLIDFFDDPKDIIIVKPDKVQIQNWTQSFNVTLTAVNAGKTIVNANSSSKDIDFSNAFVRVTVQHSMTWATISQIIGWLYFVAWSISFYPQIYDNWKRRSVIGLSFDFLGLNLIGFTLYSVFNVGLFWLKPIQADYFSRHPTGVNPVRLNDVIFSLHAMLACILTITQCVIYERGNQRVSRVSKLIFFGIALLISLTLILTIASIVRPLDFLYICSYVKLFITLVKYIPQAYLNFRRKSTVGWSIGNILLDFTGGFLSIAQMFVIAYNENDWTSIFGDPTKFGLGLFSVLFDILFMLQHYVFYKNNFPAEELIDEPEDIIHERESE